MAVRRKPVDHAHRREPTSGSGASSLAGGGSAVGSLADHLGTIGLAVGVVAGAGKAVDSQMSYEAKYSPVQEFFFELDRDTRHQPILSVATITSPRGSYVKPRRMEMVFPPDALEDINRLGTYLTSHNPVTTLKEAGGYIELINKIVAKLNALSESAKMRSDGLPKLKKYYAQQAEMAHVKHELGRIEKRAEALNNLAGYLRDGWSGGSLTGALEKAFKD